MADKDFYKVLGVDRKATPDEIKKAYRKLAMEHHPDRNRGEAASEAKLKEINEAYDVLKDEQKRAAYDRYGTAAFQGGMGGGSGAGDFGGFSGAFSDIFEDMFGDAFRRGGGGRTGGAMRGADIQYTMEISLEEAFRGKETVIKLPMQETCDLCHGSGAKPGTSAETCSTCHGAGRVRGQQGFFTIERTCPTCQGAGSIIKDPCSKCHGSGRVRKDKTLKVTIPAGMETGRRIRIVGEGEAGMKGGPNGDLYVLIAVKPHGIFQRDGANLYCRVPIPVTTAALGGSVQVPTIEGTRTDVKIPPGTQNGQQLRLREKGMSVLRSSARGDMYIEIYVETPVNLSKTQQDMLKQLDESFGAKNGGVSKNTPESSGFFKKVKEFWDDLTE